MFTIILFTYFDTIFIHKKRFRGVVPRYCSGNHSFSWHFIHERKQVLIWNINFFPFPYTWSFCKLSYYVSSYHTIFSIMPVLRSNFSANAMAREYLLLRHPSFSSGVFTFLNWQKFLLFIILLIDERLIPVFSGVWRGARCVCAEFLLVNKSVLQLYRYFPLLLLT